MHHLTGLGFKEGEEVGVHREASDLIFQGKVEKEWEEAMGGMKITRKESVEETKRLAITDIEGIDILDEAGRSLGKTALWAVGGALLLGPLAPLGLLGGALIGGRKRFKGFIVIHVKATDKLNYQIVLGGEKLKDVRNKYNKLIELSKN